MVCKEDRAGRPAQPEDETDPDAKAEILARARAQHFGPELLAAIRAHLLRLQSVANESGPADLIRLREKLMEEATLLQALVDKVGSLADRDGE